MHKKEKILLFGGTFDPIHVGHLIMAQEAVERLGFHEVVFIPSATPPHKKDILSFSHRLKMVQIATSSIDRFSVSDIEGQRDKPSFTIDTIRYFKNKPEIDNKIYWLIGTDTIPQLKTWHNIEKIARECLFVVAERNPYQCYMKDDKDWFGFLVQTKSFLRDSPINHFIPLHNLILDISSTEIREKIRCNYSCKFLIPENVEQYIYDNKLYLNE